MPITSNIYMPSGLIFTPALTSASVKSVQIEFEPSVGILARKVDKFGADIRSFKEPLRQAVRDIMIPSIRRNFDAGGRPRWVPLTLDTIKRKGGNSHPLVRGGSLRRTMGYQNIWRIDREKALIADLPQSVWYGKVHQAGGKGSHESFYDPVRRAHVNLGDDGAIPARPFVMIQRQDQIRIEALFKRWVRMRMKKAGL